MASGADGGGRAWYALDDEDRVLCVIQAGIAHPKQTEARQLGKQ